MEVVPDPGDIGRRLTVERERGFAPPTDASVDGERSLTPGVRGIGTAAFLADVGHEIPGLYNTRRLHSTADGLSPAEFERIISEARSGICQVTMPVTAWSGA
jgi:transposase InsO family protein